MAIKLIANYSKRLGLPGYSSHQFEVSIETEISNTSELPFETERLYGSLQAAVDAQIQQVGFVPDEHYGSQVTQRPVLGASCSQMISTSSVKQTPPASAPETSVATVPAWKCSEKQQSRILADRRTDESFRLFIQTFGIRQEQLHPPSRYGLCR